MPVCCARCYSASWQTAPKGASCRPLTIQVVMRGSDYVNDKLRHKLAKFGMTSAESHTAARLTTREREVLRLLTGGKSPAEVSKMLHRTIKTVSWAKISVKRKHGLKRDADLYEYARTLGLNVWCNLRTNPPSYMAGQPRHVSMGVRTDPYLTRWFSLTSHSLRSSCGHSQSFPRIRLPSHLLENIKASRVGF